MDRRGHRVMAGRSSAGQRKLPTQPSTRFQTRLQRLVHRSALLRRRPLRRPFRLLLRLAQARAAAVIRLLRDPFDPTNPLTPKAREAVRCDEIEVRRRPPKDRAFFEETMARAFAEGRRVLREDGVGSVVFAHKTTEGWEALLSGMIRGGWTITGSWPIATEMGSRLRARDSAALATSVHLVCRPRPDDAAGGRLGRRPARAAEPRRRLDGAPAGRRRPRRRPRLRLHRAGARDLQPLREGRDRRRARGRARRVPGEGLGGRGPERPRASARHRRGQGPQRRGRRRRGGRAAHGALPLDAPEHERRGGGQRERRGRGRGAVRRGRRRRGLLPQQGQGLHARLRRRAPLRAAARHRASQVGRPRHRDEEGRRAPAADRRAREATLRRGRRAGRGRAARAGGDGRHQPASGHALPRDAARRSPRDPRARPGPRKRAGVDVSDESLAAAREATTLDRVHAAMLLQAGGRTNALRALLKAEQERGPDFLRLANAFSALYPKGSEEKRLLDAMLLAVPR